MAMHLTLIEISAKCNLIAHPPLLVNSFISLHTHIPKCSEKSRRCAPLFPVNSIVRHFAI